MKVNIIYEGYDGEMYGGMTGRGIAQWLTCMVQGEACRSHPLSECPWFTPIAIDTPQISFCQLLNLWLSPAPKFWFVSQRLEQEEAGARDNSVRPTTRLLLVLGHAAYAYRPGYPSTEGCDNAQGCQ